MTEHRIPAATFLLRGTEESGFTVSRGPLAPPQDLVQINAEYMVLKRAGYAENPGSRYSGLKSYYPPETTVYQIIEWLTPRSLRAIELVCWEVGRKREVTRPDWAFTIATKDA